MLSLGSGSGQCIFFATDMTSFTNTKPGDMNRDVSQHGSESFLRAGIYNGMLVGHLISTHSAG
jgi:hypothetical protein